MADFESILLRVKELVPRLEDGSIGNHRGNELAMANIALLREAGVTAINVPNELGGIEASVAQNVRILEEVARGCGSTAFCLAIHLILTGTLRSILRGAQRDGFFSAVAGGAFVCGPFTDAGSGGNVLFPSTRASRIGDDRYRVQGTKHFFSGFEACTHMVITAAVDNVEAPHNLVAFLVPKPDGLNIQHPWDGSAMPMTGSHSVEVDIEVGAETLIAPLGMTPLVAMMNQNWGHYCFASVFLGLARRAMELAVETTRGRTNSACKSPLAMMPGIQFTLGTMRAKLASMEALLYRFAEEVCEPGDDLTEFVADTCIPKYFVTNEAQEVVKLAFDVIGGSGVRRSSRISQISADVRAGSLLPFNNDLSREMIGKTTLGINPVERPRWL